MYTRADWTSLILVGCAALASACAPDRPQLSEEADAQPPPTFRAALLTAGPVGDAGWYAGAYEGLLMLRDSLGAEVSHQQIQTPADFDEALLSLAASGNDLIFAHGFEYQDAAIRAGEAFPGATFVVSGGGRVSANVVPLIFTLEEGTRFCGGFS